MSNSAKRFLSRTLVLLGVCSLSLPVWGTVSPSGFGGTYRDSLYRHISDERVAHLDCHFTYAQGSSDIRSDLGNNSFALARLDSFIHTALSHPRLHIKRIRLTGYSSIEGTFAQNEQLAYSRVESFYEYLRSHYPALYRYPFDRAWVGEDWEGLTKLVRESRMAERYEVLEIIRTTPVFDGRELLLMRLNGGRPYREMKARMFPLLRRVEIEVEYTEEATHNNRPDGFSSFGKEESPQGEVVGSKKAVASSQHTAVNPQHVTVEVIRGNKQPETVYSPSYFSFPYSTSVGCTYTRIFALKTNLLNWAGVQYDGSYTTPLPNIALEWYINDHWSLEVGTFYSYWHYKSDEKFQGMSGYRIEPRYRFALITDRLDFYTGVYGRVGDYDLRRSTVTYNDNNKILDTTGHTGDYWDAGLSTGVHLHLSPAWGLEFGARAGYLSARGKAYTVDGGLNYFDHRRNSNKFKVTDLNVSLVYRFR